MNLRFQVADLLDNLKGHDEGWRWAANVDVLVAGESCFS